MLFIENNTFGALNVAYGAVQPDDTEFNRAVALAGDDQLTGVDDAGQILGMDSLQPLLVLDRVRSRQSVDFEHFLIPINLVRPQIPIPDTDRSSSSGQGEALAKEPEFLSY